MIVFSTLDDTDTSVTGPLEFPSFSFNLVSLFQMRSSLNSELKVRNHGFVEVVPLALEPELEAMIHYIFFSMTMCSQYRSKLIADQLSMLSDTISNLKS